MIEQREQRVQLQRVERDLHVVVDVDVDGVGVVAGVVHALEVVDAIGNGVVVGVASRDEHGVLLDLVHLLLGEKVEEIWMSTICIETTPGILLLRDIDGRREQVAEQSFPERE